MNRRGREVRLARHPVGVPTVDDFVVATADVPAPGADEVVVRNLYTSVDPGQRGLMNGGESYVATYQVGAPLSGRTVGRVVESRSPAVPEGSLVFHRLGWRELSVLPAAGVRVLPETASVDPADRLGVLGHPGLTAWLGITQVAEVRSGDVVLVSSAAGAVGATAGQLAKARGAARVVGTVGSEAKATHLRDELGYDEALCYRDPDFAQQLAAAVPDGIDVFFDNVGGAQLDLALGLMRLHGRVAVCGAMATYNETEPAPVRGFGAVLAQRLRVQGFLVYDHEDLMGDFLDEVAPLVESGRLSRTKTVFDGLDEAPRAFISLFDGTSLGKALVKVADEA